MAFRRVIFVIIDSLGIGSSAQPNNEVTCHNFNTLDCISRSVGGMSLPNLEKLGLSTLSPFQGLISNQPENGFAIKCFKSSPCLESISSYWEMAGLVPTRPFHSNGSGLPEALVKHFIEDTGVPGILGNSVISESDENFITTRATEHISSKKPILYTHGKSDLQMALDTNTFDQNEVQSLCRSARKLCDQFHIACLTSRLFVYQPSQGVLDTMTRTHHFYLDPPQGSLFDELEKEGIKTYAIGNLSCMFNHHGMTLNIKSKNYDDSIDKLIATMAQIDSGLIAVDLKDLEQSQAPKQYATALEHIDQRISEILNLLDHETLFVVGSDKGRGVDLGGILTAQEQVPFLGSSPSLPPYKEPSAPSNMASIGATIYSALTDKNFKEFESVL